MKSHNEIMNNVSGLYIFPQFMSANHCQIMLKESFNIHDKLAQALVVNNKEEEKINVSQPNMVLRDNNGFLKPKNFSRLCIHDHDGQRLNNEYFPHYGEDGHVLSYFRGNENVPAFVKEVIPSVMSLITDNAISLNDTKGEWRLTMNFYKNIAGKVSGFPFHVDIPANGIITMILNIHREAIFQITNDIDTFDIQLPVGALLLLSGDSRYKWKHRVLPSTCNSEQEQSIERVSLVLGIK